MKSVDAKHNTYIDFGKEVNDEDSKFKVGDHIRIWKYENSFAKGDSPNWSEEVFVIKNVKSTVPWSYVTSDLNSEKIIGTFYEKKLQKTNQEEFRIEWVYIFVNHMNHLEETLMLTFICQLCNKIWFKECNRCSYIKVF